MSKEKIIEKLKIFEFRTKFISEKIDIYRARIRRYLSSLDNSVLVDLLKGLDSRKNAALIFSVILEFVDERFFSEITSKGSYFKRLVIDFTRDKIQEKICTILMTDPDPEIRAKAKAILEELRSK
jgi:hypothetical protein